MAEALRAGYRLVDTAANYRNETGVGRAVARAGVPREEVVVTTKLPGRHHGHEETLASFEESRARLGLEYVDLYLIHWPLPRVDRYVDSWRAMIKLREDGLVRSIGVSNFTPAHIERLEKETGVLPSVNQIELHPFFPQEELRAYHAGKGVLIESWSPLGRGSTLLTTGPWAPSPRRTGSPRPRRCCAGTSSWACSPSPSRPIRGGSARTSTSSASRWTPPRCGRSPTAPTGGSAGIRRSTRSSDRASGAAACGGGVREGAGR
ncbi:hypothetical protein GCM10023238_37680 [Streptomyces heliomycini]